MSRPRLRVGVVLALAIACAAILMRLDPAAGGPSLSGWADLDDWYRVVGPGVLALVWVRLGAIATAVWLGAACLLQMLASRPAGRCLRPLADRIAPLALRGIASASLSAGLLASTSMVAGAGGPPGTASMRPVSEGEGTEPTTTTSVAPAPPAKPSALPVVDRAPELYTVERGESFWSIAADQVAEDVPRAPGDPEIRVYWERLIEVNRERLVDPGNADLLYAGQVLVLPPGPGGVPHA